MLLPRLDILPPPQRRLWDELAATPRGFALYGGTAIALRLGHRVSIDFDFFSTEPFRPSLLRADIPYLADGRVLQEAANTLTMSVARGGAVKLSFFGNLRIGQVDPHETSAGTGLPVASLVDLAGMKAAVVTQRSEPKDYFDLHALLTHARIPLATMLAAAAIIYGTEFNVLTALKAMTYHDDLDPIDVPAPMRRDLIAAVRGIDVERLPSLEAVRPRREPS